MLPDLNLRLLAKGSRPLLFIPYTNPISTRGADTAFPIQDRYNGPCLARRGLPELDHAARGSLSVPRHALVMLIFQGLFHLRPVQAHFMIGAWNMLSQRSRWQ